MILQSLAKYYDVLLEDENSGVSPPGYSSARVSYAAVLSQEGKLLDLEDLRVQSGKKIVARDMVVPEQIKRSSGVAPNFLCENSTYLFGVDAKGKPERSITAFNAMKKLHFDLLENSQLPIAYAIIRFFESWHPKEFNNYTCLIREQDSLEKGANIVFKLDGSTRCAHEEPKIMKIWSEYKTSALSEIIGQCLVSGEKRPIARLHPSLKGVLGSQAMGASIVSFTPSAFSSYGKEQSFNAPVSEESTFAYTTALNYLLNSAKHRIRIGDTTAVFWAEKSTHGIEESIFTELFDPIEDDEAEGDEKEKKGRKSDPLAAKKVKQLLERLKNGQSISDASLGFNAETSFYILGLSPNAARLSIRFWYQTTFGDLIIKMLQHQLDMDIIRPKNVGAMVTPWRILKEASANRDTKNISPLQAGNLARCIITGQAYGESIYTHMLSRIRADGYVNDVRVGMIKACMKRKFRKQGNSEKEAMFTVSLNTESTNTGYRLGRLFAVMEKAQQDANPGLNATIKDRYFGAASTTPGSVFPILIKLSQHHISKAEYGRFRDIEIQGILETVEAFPAYLNLDDQGQFVLGYYHQKQALYTKKAQNNIQDKEY